MRKLRVTFLVGLLLISSFFMLSLTVMAVQYSCDFESVDVGEGNFFCNDIQFNGGSNALVIDGFAYAGSKCWYMGFDDTVAFSMNSSFGYVGWKYRLDYEYPIVWGTDCLNLITVSSGSEFVAVFRVTSNDVMSFLKLEYYNRDTNWYELENISYGGEWFDFRVAVEDLDTFWYNFGGEVGYAQTYDDLSVVGMDDISFDNDDETWWIDNVLIETDLGLGLNLVHGEATCSSGLIAFDCYEGNMTVGSMVRFPYMVYGDDCCQGEFILLNSTFDEVDSEVKGEGNGLCYLELKSGYGSGTWYIQAEDVFSGTKWGNCSFTVYNPSGDTYYFNINEESYQTGETLSYSFIAPIGEEVTIKGGSPYEDYRVSFVGSGGLVKINNALYLDEPTYGTVFRMFNSSNVQKGVDSIKVVRGWDDYEINWRLDKDTDGSGDITEGDIVEFYGLNGYSGNTEVDVYLCIIDSSNDVRYNGQLNGQGDPYSIKLKMTWSGKYTVKLCFFDMPSGEYDNRYTSVDDFYKMLVVGSTVIVNDEDIREDEVDTTLWGVGIVIGMGALLSIILDSIVGFFAGSTITALALSSSEMGSYNLLPAQLGAFIIVGLVLIGFILVFTSR